MATPQQTSFCTGFEHGRVGAPYTGATAGTAVIEAASARSGNYGLRLTMAASRSAIPILRDGPTGNFDPMGRFYVKFTDFPSANYQVLTHQLAAGARYPFGWEFNASTNKVRPYLRDEGANTDYSGTDCSIDLEEGVWYRIEYLWTHPTSTSRLCEWGIAPEFEDLNLETDFNYSGTIGTYIGSLTIGEGSDRGNTCTGEFLVDDIVVHGWNDGYVPAALDIGDGKVVLLGPASDGTHNNASHFTDEAANSPPSSVYDRWDEIPPGTGAPTDYTVQTTPGAATPGSSYLEVALDDMPTEVGPLVVVNGVAFRLGYHVPTAGIRSDEIAQLYHPGLGLLLGTCTTSATSGGKKLAQTHITAYSNDTANYQVQDVNSWLARVGYGGVDIDPNIRMDDLHLEVDYPFGGPTDEAEGWGILLA